MAVSIYPYVLKFPRNTLTSVSSNRHRLLKPNKIFTKRYHMIFQKLVLSPLSIHTFVSLRSLSVRQNGHENCDLNVHENAKHFILTHIYIHIEST